jgi:cytochrome c oxidase subunit 2
VRRGSLLQLLGLTVVAFAIGAAVALLVPWLPPASSKEAGRIWFVYWFATAICVGIFAIVCAVAVYSLWKFRVKEGDLSDGPPVHGHTQLEIVWTAVPFALVTAIAIVSAIVLAKNSNAGRDPLKITVTTMQFAYTFTYPNGKTYADALRLPQNRTVQLTLESNDVIHSFWVPQFGQKSDAVPGLHNKLVITPTKIGTYPIICTQLCGLGHALMRNTAIVMSDAAFDKWYKGAAAAAPSAGSAAATFTSNGCVACHTFKAIPGAVGKVGPDLDKLKEEAARAHEALVPFIKESIVDPNKYIEPGYPKGSMPTTFGQTIPSDKLDQLVQYLAQHTS